MKILTFDIEDWFHILDNKTTKGEADWNNFESRIHEGVNRILTILSDNKVSATFFCLGWVARKYPEVIKLIDSEGYEIASHSDLHQLLYEFNKNEFKEDTLRSIDCLQQITGKKVRCYRAPGFSIMRENNWALEMLIDLGIEIDSSIFPSNRAHGGYQNFGAAQPCIIHFNGKELKELPINTGKVFGREVIFSGGGYFRFMPQALIKKLTRRSNYIMSYFHPRDFDFDQPMVPGLSMARKFKSYYGIKGCYNKLEKWLQENKFVDIDYVNANTEWKNCPVINLDE